MKTVTIEGAEYEVPDKAEYVAMDEDGDWWWYLAKPDRAINVWSKGIEQGLIKKHTQWRDSLRKI